jgi:predicted SnoaL-like aldol condensation-catalyzing enzyme
LSQTTKQKAIIIEQIKEEIEQYKSIIEENKIDRGDAKSVNSNISTASNGKEKKGFVGFVKGFFKK